MKARHSGDLSSVEAVQSSIERLDPGWLTAERFDYAVREAKEFDRRYPPRAWLPSLAGLPMLADELLAIGYEGLADRGNRLPGALNSLRVEGALLVGFFRSHSSGAEDSLPGISQADATKEVVVDPAVKALRCGAVAASAALDHCGSTIIRGFHGYDGYRPTLGLAPALGLRGTATVTFVASTLREQAFLLDRLRAAGVLGDPRFLPHSNPKSLTSFVASPLAPSKVMVLRVSDGLAEHRRDPNDPLGAAVSILTAKHIEYEVVDLDGHLLSPVDSEPESADQMQALIVAIDELVGSVDLLAFDLVNDPIVRQMKLGRLWCLAELANLPMVVLADAGVALVGARFGDARLLRMAAFVADS